MADIGFHPQEFKHMDMVNKLMLFVKRKKKKCLIKIYCSNFHFIRFLKMILKLMYVFKCLVDI